MAGPVVALGGGGFSDSGQFTSLDGWALAKSGKAIPRVCFVPTASGDADGYIEKFYAAFGSDRAVASHLTLFRQPSAPPERLLAEADVIYVGGGSTANMLAVWQVQGLDSLFRDAWIRGVVLCGVSAGAMCWFDRLLTPVAGVYKPLPGLGLVSGSFCPHYGDPERADAYRAAIAAGELPEGYAAEDDVALCFHNGGVEAMTGTPGRRAYSVVRAAGTPRETRQDELPARLLD